MPSHQSDSKENDKIIEYNTPKKNDKTILNFTLAPGETK